MGDLSFCGLTVQPSAGRLSIGSKGRESNLKEPRARHRRAVLRVRFVFDPRRRAVLLVGGDKAGGDDQPAQWNRWYQRAVPLAEAIYEEYLRRESLGAEERDND